MAEFPKVDRLKSQLITSGLQGKDPALFQIINTLIDFVRQGQIVTTEIVAASGGSALAIDALNTDVVATGPGNVVATIQPDAITTTKILNSSVTYPKIQNTVLPDILIGRGMPAGVVQEIGLGANLQIVGNTLQVTTSGGGSGGGLSHNFLSATHPDTVAASPIFGDLVYAGTGTTFVGTYVNAVILNPVSENLALGIYGALYLGFDNSGLIAPTSGAISIRSGSLISSVLPQTWLTWDIIDAIILNPVVDANSTGIWGYLNGLTPGQFPSGPGVNGAITTIPFTIIPAPSPTPTYSSGLWRRKAIGADAQVLTVVSGIPEWATLPVVYYPWQTITFVAGDFTATGGVGPGWTVDAGDVVRWQYQQFPSAAGTYNVRIALYLKTTTVAGTAPTRLEITLPFSILGEYAQFISMRENSVSVTNVAVFYRDSLAINKLFIEKVPSSAVFDTTANETYLAFEISATLAP